MDHDISFIQGSCRNIFKYSICLLKGTSMVLENEEAFINIYSIWLYPIVYVYILYFMA